MAAAWDVIQHYVKLPGLDQVSFGHPAVNVAPGTYGMIALFALALPGPWSSALGQNSEGPGNFNDPWA